MVNIKEILLKNERKIIGISSVILLFVSILSVYFVTFVNISSNDECVWHQRIATKDTTIIVFRNVKVNGVTWDAGVRNGDQLIAINHIKLTSNLQAQSIIDSLKSGDHALYTFKHNGKVLTGKVEIKKLIQVDRLANSLMAVMWMLIAFIVLMAKPRGTVQRMFYAIAVATVFISLNSFFPRLLTNEMIMAKPVAYFVAGIFIFLGISFYPFLLLAFCWMFPMQFKFWKKQWVKILIFAVPSIIFLINLISIILIPQGNIANLENFNTIRNYINNISFSVIQIVAVISLIVNYTRLKTKREKQSIIFIIIAFVIGIVASLYTARIAPIISDTLFNSPEYYTPIILITLIPIAFAYSIFKYQLMDVSIVIKNTLMYGIATIALAATYFFVIYVLGQTISEAIGTEFQSVIAGIVFISFALVFQSTKDRFQDFITSKFYPEQFAYQRVLLKFSNDISTVVGLDNILDSMQKTFVDSLRLNKFGILLRNSTPYQFDLVRNTGFVNKNFVLTSSDLNVFIEEKSIINNHVTIEQSEFEKLFSEQSHELVAEGIYTIVPMVIKSKVVGLLMFGLKHSGAQFAGKDLELLHASANQSAIAIENARLYQSEAEKHKIERDLDLARRIQQGLLPSCIPEISGLDICGEMISAMQVGGDYYDLINISDSKIFVVVGDVSGKGLSASLYMTKVQTMMQLACVEGKSPRDILVDVNSRIYTSLERNSFVTMTLALFDMETRKVSFCRAGHMPILISQNGRVDSYRTQGLGIGLEKGTIFEKTLLVEEIELKSGQIFAFFSDGITEAMNEKFELFGENKLSEIINTNSVCRSSEIMDKIWADLKSYKGKAPQNDDMTMVIVRVSK